MRVIAVIDDPQIVETIARRLGVGHDPPPKAPPHGLPGHLIGRVGSRKDSIPQPSNGVDFVNGVLAFCSTSVCAVAGLEDAIPSGLG